MKIHSLGYVRLESTDVGQWRGFAEDVLGLRATDGPDGSLRLRMDERPVRIAIVPGQHDRLVAAGLELRDKAALDAAVAQLEAAGVAVKEGSAADAEERLVERFVSVQDPSGNPVELFYSQQVDGLPFSLPHGGEFVTGALGAGHVVLPTDRHRRRVRLLHPAARAGAPGLDDRPPPGPPAPQAALPGLQPAPSHDRAHTKLTHRRACGT